MAAFKQMSASFWRFSRQRLAYLAICILLIAISLPARYTDWYPSFVVIYVADAVWAMMVYLLLAALFPEIVPFRLLILALVGSWLVEFSQLYQATWINELRQWRLVGLLIGYGFRVSDLVAYTLGIAVAFWLDIAVLRQWFARISINRGAV